MKLWALAIPQLLVLALVLYLYSRSRSMKNRQDQLVESLRGQRYWRVNLARPAFYQSWLRVMPFEAKGVLIDEGDQLRIKGFWLRDSRPFESAIDKADCQPEWVGNRHMRAGNLHWARLTTPRGELLFCADTGLYALPSREALADIFRSAFPAYALDSQQTHDFALEKNPRSLALVALFFALLLFSLLDTFVITQFELTDAQLFRILTSPWTWLGLLAVLGPGMALVYRYLLAGQVPARESLTLSLLLTTALLGGAMPIAKRLDQWLASAPSHSYTYRITQLAHLEPVDPLLGLPALRFPRAKDYWQQFPTDSEYPVPFLRGPLGLWQLDHAIFDKPMIDFYERQAASK